MIFFLALALPFTRPLVDKYYNVSIGKGPSRERLKKTKYEESFCAEADVSFDKLVNGRRPCVMASLSTPYDAGYMFTAVMVGQCAILLARNKQLRSGVLTPALAFGDRLLEPLVQHGLKWKFHDSS